MMLRVLAALFALSVAGIASACPFCVPGGKTLTDEFNQADLVIFGKLVGANEKAETSDIQVEKAVKNSEKRPAGKTVQVKKFLDPMLITDKERLLLFCEFYKGGIDPYRGIVVRPDSTLPTYLTGSARMKGKPVAERLKFFFSYLDDAEPEVSMDAYREFANSDYKDYAGMARHLPAEKVVKWLKAAETQPFRIGLYASMLGHCGKEKDAEVIKELLKDPERRSGVDGLLAAYVMLRKDEGWKYLTGMLDNSKEEFSQRYAALRAVRFLHDFRTDLVSKKDCEEAVITLLAQDDISDMAIEDLRKWKCWRAADKVLAIRKTEAYKESTVIRRSILRYCLQCEGHAGAKAYVEQRRKEDAEAVKDAEELLKLDEDTAPKSREAGK